MNVLEVSGLSTSFATERGRIPVLDAVDLAIPAGASHGLVGESGCGKSITALSIMRLLPRPHGKIEQGRILFDGRDLATLDTQSMRALRGNRVAMIFQEPMTSLNPVQTIGKQLLETFKLHRPSLSRYDRKRRALQMLAEVGIPSPDKRIVEYPHQLSGGMRQRVMIAMALALEPQLLIADEPTTALDVTIQAQILALINQLRERHGTAVLLITHDLGVIAQSCERVSVMYAGRIVEHASTADFFKQARHPYSRGLLKAIPHPDDTPRSQLHVIPGTVPAIDQFESGCRFYQRCTLARSNCRQQRPPMQTVQQDHHTACLFWQEID